MVKADLKKNYAPVQVCPASAGRISWRFTTIRGWTSIYVKMDRINVTPAATGTSTAHLFF
jgi:hypothetical protein